MEESSFETLEALAMAICRYLVARLLVAEDRNEVANYRLKICLEKPIAVTLADAPCVELSVEAKDVMDITGQ